jgi:vacuolar-type H+-ATPase subunit I/STV1
MQSWRVALDEIVQNFEARASELRDVKKHLREKFERDNSLLEKDIEAVLTRAENARIRHNALSKALGEKCQFDDLGKSKIVVAEAYVPPEKPAKPQKSQKPKS